MANDVRNTVETLFREHGSIVYRRAYSLLGHHEDAEEATQEVFARVICSLPDFDNRCTMQTWLYTITTNYCLDRLRKDTKWRRTIALRPSIGEKVPGVQPSDLVLLQRLLAEADQDQARAVIYVYMDGMKHEQAAEVLGVSKRTVGNLIERFLAWAKRRSEDPHRTVSDAASRLRALRRKREHGDG